MRWNSLSETLVDLARAVVPPQGTGIVVTEAVLQVPLEVRLDPSVGGLHVFAQPGHTRWKSGFLPPTHVARISLILENGDGG